MRSETPLDELRAGLQSKDHIERLSTLLFIADFADDARLLLSELEMLIRNLVEDNESQAIARALASAVPECIPIIRKYVCSENPLIAECCLTSIREMATRGPHHALSLADDVWNLIGNHDSFLANRALETIGSLGKRASKFIAPIVELIASKKNDITTTAIYTLGRLGKSTESVRLLELLIASAVEAPLEYPMLTIVGAIVDMRADSAPIIATLKMFVLADFQNNPETRQAQLLAVSALATVLSKVRALECLSTLFGRCPDPLVNNKIRQMMEFLNG